MQSFDKASAEGEKYCGSGHLKEDSRGLRPIAVRTDALASLRSQNSHRLDPETATQHARQCRSKYHRIRQCLAGETDA